VSRGRFVVFEGGDGSGKSTQASRLAAWLREQGLAVHETFEPGAGATGAVIRELLLHGPEAVTPTAEALLMAADRAQHVAAEIEPALARGEWVVCDRYVPSSLVYQGVVRGLGVDLVAQLSQVATQGLTPDLVLVLDVTDDVAASRQGDEPDRLEREGSEFHAAVRRAYRDLAPTRGWTLLDADATVDDVAARVRSSVTPLLPG
jgi:dTMP kinase